MARKLRVEVDGDSKGGRKALDDVADEAEKAARAADKLSAQFRDTGNTSKRTAVDLAALAREADKAAGEMNDAARAAGKLDTQLAAARGEVDKLRRSFAESGDAEVLKQLQEQTREYDKISNIRKRFAKDEEEARKRGQGIAAEAVAEAKRLKNLVDGTGGRGLLGQLFFGASGEAAKTAVKSFGDIFEAIPVQAKVGVAAGLAAAVVIAAPAITAAIEGAVLAGVGAAGIGAGIALAVRNPAVTQAYGRLGTDIMKSLDDSAKPFVGELLAAAPRFSAAFAAESGRIRDILRTLSTGVSPLIDAAIATVHELLPGVQAAASASVPVLRQFAAQLPALGSAIGGLLKAFAEAGPGAGAALAEVVKQTSLLINILAVGAHTAAPLLNALAAFGESVGLVDGQVSVLTTSVNKADAEADKAAQDYSILAQSLGNTANQADAANEAFGRLFDEQMSVDQANLAVNVGLSNLTETIKNNKKTLDESTESGQQNVGVILDQIQKLDQKRQADIKAGNGTKEATDAANAAYASQIQSLEKTLIKLGLTKDEVYRLVTAYEAIPDEINTTVKTHYRSDGTPPQGHSRDVAGQSAGGGTVPFSGFRRVGEQGPEIQWADKRNYFSTASETKRLVAAWSAVSSGGGMGGGGGGVQAVDLLVNGVFVKRIIIDEAARRGQTVSAFLGIG